MLKMFAPLVEPSKQFAAVSGLDAMLGLPFSNVVDVNLDFSMKFYTQFIDCQLL